MLARRSAEAAKEIASLIHASTERVESGTRQVQAAGSTMDDIVRSVERVSHIIREISATTGAQSGEIGMVSESVTELDQMTQQNAALVEESAAAAESMKQQALRLSELVNAFKLPLTPMCGDDNNQAISLFKVPCPSYQGKIEEY